MSYIDAEIHSKVTTHWGLPYSTHFSIQNDESSRYSDSNGPDTILLLKNLKLFFGVLVTYKAFESSCINNLDTSVAFVVLLQLLYKSESSYDSPD